MALADKSSTFTYNLFKITQFDLEGEGFTQFELIFKNKKNVMHPVHKRFFNAYFRLC